MRRPVVENANGLVGRCRFGLPSGPSEFNTRKHGDGRPEGAARPSAGVRARHCAPCAPSPRSKQVVVVRRVATIEDATNGGPGGRARNRCCARVVDRLLVVGALRVRHGVAFFVTLSLTLR